MELPMLPVAILAGGLATRLRPLTETIPKSLIPISGEPFIAHQLRLLKSRGLERVVLCVGYLGEMVQEFVGDGASFGLAVDYSSDGTEPLGTAGALKRAAPLLADAFFVVYGDSYLPCNYRDVESAFFASGKQGLMTVFRNEGSFDSSNVEFDGGAILAYDKQNRTPRMRHIDYGLGVLKRSVITDLPGGPYDLAKVYQELLTRDELAALEMTERFYETGSFEGIQSFAELTSNNS
jgi:MurNAc alpha-1-phosphate uridylyltransferase